MITFTVSALRGVSAVAADSFGPCQVNGCKCRSADGLPQHMRYAKRTSVRTPFTFAQLLVKKGVCCNVVEQHAMHSPQAVLRVASSCALIRRSILLNGQPNVAWGISYLAAFV